MNETESAIAAALGQTGFPFEHHIFEEARRLGWTTIPNRLYVDAEEDKTREMDLLCYKAGLGAQGVTVYTALLISCKARTDKPWVVMTRPWPYQRPAWYPYPPVPVWTNSIPLRHECGKSSWGLEYFDLASCTGLDEWARDSREEVFALQEFEALRDGKNKLLQPPRFKSLGDTSLYAGSMGLLKALAFELAAVDARRAEGKDRFAYQFNLIQMLDGGLYEASFARSSPNVTPVDRYRYFARTMLGGKDLSARIDFCTKSALPSLLKDMEKLHRFNVMHFNGLERTFYEKLKHDPQRLTALKPLILPKIISLYTVYFPNLPKLEPSEVDVEYEAATNELTVQVYGHATSEQIESAPNFVRAVQELVGRVYQHDGPVLVDNDIPF